ncbi:MAG TPA: hypothetical protein VFC05_04470 [Nitrososphaeraceae archaeon]|nr:hypothetical protein [Nitrososphaeraceae archaeon]
MNRTFALFASHWWHHFHHLNSPVSPVLNYFIFLRTIVFVIKRITAWCSGGAGFYHF